MKQHEHYVINSRISFLNIAVNKYWYSNKRLKNQTEPIETRSLRAMSGGAGGAGVPVSPALATQYPNLETRPSQVDGAGDGKEVQSLRVWISKYLG